MNCAALAIFLLTAPSWGARLNSKSVPVQCSQFRLSSVESMCFRPYFPCDEEGDDLLAMVKVEGYEPVFEKLPYKSGERERAMGEIYGACSVPAQVCITKDLNAESHGIDDDLFWKEEAVCESFTLPDCPLRRQNVRRIQSQPSILVKDDNDDVVENPALHRTNGARRISDGDDLNVGLDAVENPALHRTNGARRISDVQDDVVQAAGEILETVQSAESIPALADAVEEDGTTEETPEILTKLRNKLWEEAQEKVAELERKKQNEGSVQAAAEEPKMLVDLKKKLKEMILQKLEEARESTAEVTAEDEGVGEDADSTGQKISEKKRKKIEHGRNRKEKQRTEKAEKEAKKEARLAKNKEVSKAAEILRSVQSAESIPALADTVEEDGKTEETQKIIDLRNKLWEEAQEKVAELERKKQDEGSVQAAAEEPKMLVDLKKKLKEMIHQKLDDELDVDLDAVEDPPLHRTKGARRISDGDDDDLDVDLDAVENPPLHRTKGARRISDGDDDDDLDVDLDAVENPAFHRTNGARRISDDDVDLDAYPIPPLIHRQKPVQDDVVQAAKEILETVQSAESIPALADAVEEDGTTEETPEMLTKLRNNIREEVQGELAELERKKQNEGSVQEAAEEPKILVDLKKKLKEMILQKLDEARVSTTEVTAEDENDGADADSTGPKISEKRRKKIEHGRHRREKQRTEKAEKEAKKAEKEAKREARLANKHPHGLVASTPQESNTLEMNKGPVSIEAKKEVRLASTPQESNTLETNKGPVSIEAKKEVRLAKKHPDGLVASASQESNTLEMSPVIPAVDEVKEHKEQQLDDAPEPEPERIKPMDAKTHEESKTNRIGIMVALATSVLATFEFQ